MLQEEEFQEAEDEFQEAEDEFQEADILWPDAADFQEYQIGIGIDNDDDDSSSSSEHHQPSFKLRIRQKASSPIDIPGRKKKVVVGGATAARGTGAPAGSSKFSASHASGVGASSAVIGSHVFMPPHVIVDRRAKRDKAMMMLIVPSGRARARKIMPE